MKSCPFSPRLAPSRPEHGPPLCPANPLCICPPPIGHSAATGHSVIRLQPSSPVGKSRSVLLWRRTCSSPAEIPFTGPHRLFVTQLPWQLPCCHPFPSTPSRPNLLKKKHTQRKKTQTVECMPQLTSTTVSKIKHHVTQTPPRCFPLSAEVPPCKSRSDVAASVSSEHSLPLSHFILHFQI